MYVTMQDIIRNKFKKEWEICFWSRMGNRLIQSKIEGSLKWYSELLWTEKGPTVEHVHVFLLVRGCGETIRLCIQNVYSSNATIAFATCLADHV